MSRFITLTTHIAAPVETCFLLSLNIDLHKESMKYSSFRKEQTADEYTMCPKHTSYIHMKASKEKAIAGITKGLIHCGETVTWQARHFGISWKMTTLISKYQYPFYFVSEMVKGPFARFHHQHIFKENGIHTIMTDIVELKAPLGILGHFAEWLFLKKKLRKSLEERNRIIKKTAQSDEWKKYLTESHIPMEKAG